MGKEHTHKGCRGQTTLTKPLLFDLGLTKRVIVVMFFAAQAHALRGKQTLADTAARPFGARTVGVSGPLWVAGGGRAYGGAFDASGQV